MKHFAYGLNEDTRFTTHTHRLGLMAWYEVGLEFVHSKMMA